MAENTNTETPVLHVYGASDDLIEVEGAVRDELDPPYGKPVIVAVTARTDDGRQVQVRLRVSYAMDGTSDWRITELAGHGLVTITRARGEDEGPDADGCPGYSDKATIRGGTAVQLLEDDGTDPSPDPDPDPEPEPQAPAAAPQPDPSGAPGADLLTVIEADLDAVTALPWKRHSVDFREQRSHSVKSAAGSVVSHAGYGPDGATSYRNADLQANAPTYLRALVTVLRTVQKRHQPIANTKWYQRRCVECGNQWPCATATDLAPVAGAA